MEEQIVELATAAESAHARRCDPNVIRESACGDQNYHACGTRLPNPQCHAGFHHPACGVACSVVKDYTVSSVNIKDVTQPDQPHLSDLNKETICWTRLLDEAFLANDAAHSASVSFPTHVDRPVSYFAHEDTGLIRTFPGGYARGNPVLISLVGFGRVAST